MDHEWALKKAKVERPQIDRRRARKLEEAILYIERNPKLVKSITSFPYIVKSL
jgi:hypothetical protein